jgi:hypothetical protein
MEEDKNKPDTAMEIDLQNETATKEEPKGYGKG